MSKGNFILEAKNICKSFGKVIAVKNVSFNLHYGEILGLLGDNGAGKTTLIKMIVGLFTPNSGDIYYNGKRVKFTSPAEARKEGIEIVYQNLSLIDLMNIRQNFFLGKEINRKILGFNFLDNKKMDKECKKSMEWLGIKVRSSNEDVSLLSGGERQSICIGRSMYFGANLIILDEPTAALSVKESKKVLEFIKRVKEEGISVVHISHNIYHAYEVCDRFLLMDHGIIIGEFVRNDVTTNDLINIISKGEIDPNLEKYNLCHV